MSSLFFKAIRLTLVFAKGELTARLRSPLKPLFLYIMFNI